MEKVTIDDVRNEVNPMQVHDVRRPVSDALGTDHFAMNYFELTPGDSFSGGLHTHHDQEEVFYIEEGTAVFEVGKEREQMTVEGGEVIRFEPGEFQMGYAKKENGNEVIGWAMGAPGSTHDWEELESVVSCRECEGEVPHATRINSEGRFEFTCTECGNEFAM
ncbi:cupin domain-containing protein [Natronococcus sp.]|uniref:cupin domain-containing protein n=1 Tax=Natronococcus sp. TaxID=35747 RepID=UPI0025E281DA|nr:cupin domain-containing protein [Natronococcus sp.]